MSVSESLSHSANTEDQSSAIHTELQQLVMCGCACMQMYVAASIHGAWHVLSKMSGAKAKNGSCFLGKSVLNSTRIVGTLAGFAKEGLVWFLSIMDTYQA